MTLAEIGLIFILALLACAFFSGAEIALLSAHPAVLRRRALPNTRQAVIVEQFLVRPQWFLAATLLGAILSLLAAIVPVASYLIARFHSLGLVAAFVGIGPVVIFFGRVLPKIFFLPRANRTAIQALLALRPLIYLFYPFLLLLLALGSVVGKIVGAGRLPRTFWYTRDQLKLLLTRPHSRLELALDDEGRLMIDRVFEFTETEVEEVMIPLVEVEALEESMPAGEALRKISQRMFSRYPVYRGRIDNVIGVLETLDLLKADDHFAAVSSWVRPARYVPYNKPVDELLFAMQRENFNFAVVVDEYGGCVGIITREDIVEEIVGEIEEEHLPPAALYKELGPGHYLVSGRMNLYDINEQFGWSFPEGNYETLAGFLLSLFRRIPLPGERLRYGRFLFTIRAASARAIQEVEVEFKERT